MKSSNQVKIFIHCRSSIPDRVKKLLVSSARLTLTHIPASVFKKMTQGMPEGHLTVALVGPKTIQKLNHSYRKKNKPTDVLSFSRIETSPFPLLQNNDIGDVLICWEIAKKQAKAYSTTLEEELSRLTVHGILHLFGYDHERSLAEEKKMFSLQEKILKALKKN